MKKHYIPTLCTLLLFIVSCRGQTKTAEPKLIKNHFITQFPDETFFVQCGLQDQKGHMWFGSAGDGIYYYDGTGFTNFTKLDGLCHIDILCCLGDKSGNIWFGTRNGLIRYRPSGGPPSRKDFSCLLIAANVIAQAGSKTKIPYTYQPADNFVWSILQDKNGLLWFGTNKGVYVHNPSTDVENDLPLFTSFLNNDNLINTEQLHLKDISGMTQDAKGNIWFVSGYAKGEGICRYDGKSLVSFKPGGVSSFRSVMKRKNGELLFLNTFEGIYSYDGKTFSPFLEKIGLAKDTMVAMLEDKAGNLWFGCTSDNMMNGGEGGVWRYDGKSLQLFTTMDGLSHNCVFCIVEEKDKSIWFGTRNTGLCRYDGKSFTDFTER